MAPVAPTSSIVAAPAVPTAKSRRSPLDVRAITLEDGFLGDWQALNRDATIPHCIARMETSGVMDNLRRLAGESTALFRGPLFADSDLYKTLEAIGWEEVRGDTSELAPFVDEAVRLLREVQEPDGYLNSYYQGPRAGERFSDLAQGHELYCLGHLVQAAIAWSYAGRDELLEIALRFVELVHETFGAGGREEICGHPQIETALVELSRVTGDSRHRDLARLMIDRRGHRTVGEGMFGGAYYQDLVPVKVAREATGHAVRQLYLLAGVADVELDDPDESGYAAALDSIWSNVHEKKLYVTGGLGSRHRGEAFGDPYELPADRAYSETCAAIANLQWNWRMLLLHGDAKYADEMERGLYNAIAVSTSLDGRSYFYSNPLQLRTGHDHEEDAPSTRLDWYNCACCPPNLARLLSSITSYLVTETEDAVQFQLYAAGTFDLGGGTTAHVRTDFPWNGVVEITLDQPSNRAIELRVPDWAAGATLSTDGAPASPVAAGYARVEAQTRTIRLSLPVSPVVEAAHPWVDATRGSVAVRRGPVYYAMESADLPHGVALEDVVLPADPDPVDAGWDQLLNVPVLTIDRARRREAVDRLYSSRADEPGSEVDLGVVRVIPYFRWANRTPGAMRVWMPTV